MHLQLIKFWPSRAPVKGVCGGAKIFGSALLQPARSVCVSLSAFLNPKYFPTSLRPLANSVLRNCGCCAVLCADKLTVDVLYNVGAYTS